MNLKQKAFSGLRWTATSNVTVNLLQIAQTAIVARFLDSRDFGVMAICMVVAGISSTFFDLGFSNAVIHKQDISKRQLSTLYWMNVITGFVIFAALCLLAGKLSEFYQEKELYPAVIITGTVFIIQSFSQQFLTLWQKELRFAEIAGTEIVAKILSLLVAVTLAWKGFGVYALVYGLLLSTAYTSLSFIVKGFREQRIALAFSLSEVRPFLSFGFFQMGERIINYFQFQLDTLLIGKLLGLDALGLYNISKQIVIRPSTTINPMVLKVSFPVMAFLQYEPQKLKETFLKTIRNLSYVNFPIYTMILLFSEEIIIFLYGPQWLAAAPLLRILAVWAAIRSTANPAGYLLLAKGKASWGFWWNVVVMLIVTPAIFLGAAQGISGICWALLTIQLLLIIPNWYFLVRPVANTSFTEYHWQLLKPALLAILGMSLTAAATFRIENHLFRIVAGLAAGGGSFLLIYLLWNKEFIKNIKTLLKMG